MATDSRTFHLGDILTVTTDRMLSPRHIDGLYDLLGFMVGEPVPTHQLPRVGDECVPELLRQHPDLANIQVPPEFPEPREETVPAWLAVQVAKFGEYRMVAPLSPEDHTSIDPFDEVAMNHPHMQVIPLGVPDGR